MSAPRPLLPAAVPLLRAGPDTVQVGGVDSAVGLRISPAGRSLATLLRGLDGRRPQSVVIDEARARGLPEHDVAAVLDGLRTVGLLVDLDAADLLAGEAGPAATARAATELPAVPPGSRRARRSAVVVVDGAGRVGAPLAAVLAASGIGRVVVRDRGLATAADAVVGGIAAADEGRPRSAAAADAVRRASPLADLRALPAGAQADLVVLTRPWAASDPTSAGAHRSRTPHLVATVRGRTGVIGPLVLPGRTACLRCGDLHRRDEDPAWPALAAQLTRGDAPPAGSTVTCLLTAATAAVQVLAYLDGAGAPLTLDGTVELRPPDLVPRLRPWPPHPACGCLEVGQGTEGVVPPPGGLDPTPAGGTGTGKEE